MSEPKRFVTKIRKPLFISIAILTVAAIVFPILYFFTGLFVSSTDLGLKDLTQGATIAHASTDSINSSARNVLQNNRLVWRTPTGADVGGSHLIIDLNSSQKFNVMILDETSSMVKVFSVHVSNCLDEEFTRVYMGDSMLNPRLISFDAVTARYVKLVIDDSHHATSESGQSNSHNLPVTIRRIRVFYAPRADRSGLHITAYTVFRGVPDSLPYDNGLDAVGILAQGDEYARNFARIFDVYNHIIICSSIRWVSDQLRFARHMGDQQPIDCATTQIENRKNFEAQLLALRQLVDLRGNQKRDVHIILNVMTGAAASGEQNQQVFATKQRMTNVQSQIRELYELYSQPENGGIVGLDFDMETLSLATVITPDLLWQRYAELISGVRQDHPNTFISIALQPWELAPQGSTIYSDVDRINLMSYDVGEDRTRGAHSTFYRVYHDLLLRPLRNYRHKVNLAFVSYGFTTNAAGTRIDWYAPEGIWRNHVAGDTVRNDNYWLSRIGDNHPYMYMNSPALVADKLALAMLTDVGGIFLWRLELDAPPNNPNSLFQGLYDGLRRHATIW